MTPTQIDRLLRVAGPLQLHAQRLDASAAVLRCDLEALGIDPDALALAVGADPAPVIDSGLSARPDYTGPVTLIPLDSATDCTLCAEQTDKLRAAERALDNLRDALASNQGLLNNQRCRTHRLAAIARKLRSQRDTNADNGDAYRLTCDDLAAKLLAVTEQRDGLRKLSEGQDRDLEALRAELARKPAVMGEGEELVNTTRAAVLADCPGSTVSRAAKLGDLAAVDGGPGRGNLYRISDVLAWAKGRRDGFECAGREGCPNRTVRAGTLCSGCRGAISRGAVLRPLPAPVAVPTIIPVVEAPTPPTPPAPVPTTSNRDAAIEAGRWSWENQWQQDARGFWLIRESSGRFRAARVGSDLATGETKIALIVRNRAGAWDERPYQRNGHLAAPQALPPSVMARPAIRVREDGGDVYEAAP